MTKKAVVTGGAGFIGSHMVERLLNDGHEVVVIDNFSSGRPENLANLKNQERLTVIESDICDAEKVKACFTDVSWVFHFAGLGDIVPSIEQPTRYMHANVEGTLTLLEACRNANIEKLVYAASSSCYGIPDVYPTPEDAPLKPEYPYALSKLMAEEMIMHWEKVYNLPAISMRLFNVYGPRSRTSGAYGAVLGVFLKQKLSNKPFTIVGDGMQTRDFTYVTDVVDGFLKAAQSDISGEIMNIGSDGSYSINKLVSLLEGDIEYIPKRPGEPDCTYADITKIRRLLNWEPSVSFEAGVKKVLENIDYWQEAPLWTPESISQATQKWFKYLGDEG
ncbi:SDR family oxidoreductase [Curvivirga aplysinae]|uniref:SDR family oxidoreductase n=1 Tax=Curvivirga aplysinae TaxID=2529852 RepID=UPI0012BD6C69|nr:SDR family oxidoreductase [Curvivirga aplysinae]MTI08916.1 SDR family oxidoreductase [Curvivirga aplysinae]